jgi:hypothetical protein
VELYVDGVKILEITSLNTDTYGEADRVEIGVIQAKNVQNSLQVYGDCVVVSNSYIGLEP